MFVAPAMHAGDVGAGTHNGVRTKNRRGFQNRKQVFSKHSWSAVCHWFAAENGSASAKVDDWHLSYDGAAESIPRANQTVRCTKSNNLTLLS